MLETLVSSAQVTVRRPWTRFLVLAAAGLSGLVACVPEYKFVEEAPPAVPDHCDNGVLEPALGETDLDCGGLDCRGCELTQSCIGSTDCVEGNCLDGTCQLPGCDNESQDAGETALNCGGPCDPCSTGQGCLEHADCQSSVCTDNVCRAATCEDNTLNGEETARDCGGPRCDGCDPGEHCEVATDCSSAICDETTDLCQVRCVEGTGECDDDYEDQCETNLLVTAEHCGACGKACNLAHADASCSGGECRIERCEAPWDRCNTDDADGCEANLSADPDNCGGCGTVCSDDHGSPKCVNSACEIECADDYEDCNDSRDDGCEVWLVRDVHHCGECDEVCEPMDGLEPYCSDDGVCGWSDCEAGTGNCLGNPDGSCEQNLRTDIEHCGRCGGLCTVQNGTPDCEDGVCIVDDCEAGYDNCNDEEEDGGYADGCETNLLNDEDNCGSCGNACSAEHGTATCVSGKCQIESCEAGYDNCDDGAEDGGYADGCETETASDKENCGGCGEMGVNCDAAFSSLNATGRCVSSACRVDDCFDTFGDCDDDPNNGCESDLRIDERDCGGCLRECIAAGTEGSPGNECVGGECVPSCDANHLDCDGVGENGCEVDRLTDDEHCGACGSACADVGGTNSCSNGVCLLGCDESHLDCNGDPSDGCETLCSSEGTSGRSCDGAACTVTCDGAHLTCDTNQANGCEVTRSVTNCATCGQVCSDTNASEVACTNGVCAPSCLPGWGACGEPQDGCTTRLNADPFCGSCAGDCGGETPACVATGDDYRCQAGITLVNSTSGSSASATLNFDHTLQPGAARMVLVALVAECGGKGIEGSRPTTLTYGGTAMIAGPTQPGSNQTADPGFWSPDLFFYYLTESDLAGKTGTQRIAIDATPGADDPTVMAAFAIQFTGVRQTDPVTGTANSGGTVLAAAAPPNISHGIAVETSGARVLSLVGTTWSPVPTPSISPQDGGSMPTVLAPPPVVTNVTELRIAALYVAGPNPTTLSPRTYTTTWTYPTTSMYATPHSRTAKNIVIHPLQRP
jgi:hypothetical protein